jgi:hypothetical protein
MTEKEQNISGEIEKYREQGYNVLMPSIRIEGLSEFHSPVIEQVKLSADPNDGDVYDPRDGTKKLRPTKQALMKLSVCAGIIWSPTETRRIDNRSDRNYIAYQAVGGIKKPDGTPVFFKATYDLDFEVMEEELHELYTKKVEAGTKPKDDGSAGWSANMNEERREKWVDDNVRRDLIQKRKHGLKLCEAGAMNRVVREILGLKQAYTPKELSQPFVTARIVWRPDYTDKEVKSKLIDAHVAALTGIWGDTAAPRRPDMPEPIDVTPAQEDEAAGGNGQDASPEGGNGDGTGDGQKADVLASFVTDFQNCDLTHQGTTIRTMAKQKGYDLEGFLARCKKALVEEVSDAKRLELFKHLLTLPPVTMAAAFPDEDVPF